MLRLGIGLQIKRALANIVAKLTSLYKTRVTADSGSTRTINSVETIYQWFKDNNLLDYIKFLWFAEAGIKIANPSDTLKRLSKGYSLDSTPNNWTQTTEANQPYLSGDIAPIEKYAAKNVQGVNRTISHSNIAFAQGEEWTYSVIINHEWGTFSSITIASNGTLSNRIILRAGKSAKYFYVQCGTAYPFYTLQTPRLCGKNAIITIVAKSNNISVYVNDEPVITVNGTNTAFTFNKRFSGTTVDAFYGKQYFDLILSKAITPAQKTSLHTLLRTMIPEIETVQIGTQHWATSNYDAVVTPMGTEIPNVTDAGAWAALSTPAWCYYNNDPATGAIYGKLYNWYAVKQLQDDIDAWNAANPTNRFGYHVPTSTEFATLSAALGGYSVAGGKLKVAGTTYWESPNTGADNSSGFSILPSGYRTDVGDFGFITFRVYQWTITDAGDDAYRCYVRYNSSTASIALANKKYGNPIRLLKD